MIFLWFFRWLTKLIDFHTELRETFALYELITPESSSFPGRYHRALPGQKDVLVHRTRVFLPLTYDESPDVYTRRYTRARRELVAFLRVSLIEWSHYCASSVPVEPSLVATDSPRRAHPTSTFSLPTIFIIYNPLCAFTDEEEKNGRRENKRRRAHPYWVGGSKQAVVRVHVVIENSNLSHATRGSLSDVFLARDWLAFDYMGALVLFMFLCRPRFVHHVILSHVNVVLPQCLLCMQHVLKVRFHVRILLKVNR